MVTFMRSIYMSSNFSIQSVRYLSMFVINEQAYLTDIYFNLAQSVQ